MNRIDPTPGDPPPHAPLADEVMARCDALLSTDWNSATVTWKTYVQRFLAQDPAHLDGLLTRCLGGHLDEDVRGAVWEATVQQGRRDLIKGQLDLAGARAGQRGLDALMDALARGDAPIRRAILEHLDLETGENQQRMRTLVSTHARMALTGVDDGRGLATTCDIISATGHDCGAGEVLVGFYTQAYAFSSIAGTTVDGQNIRSGLNTRMRKALGALHHHGASVDLEKTLATAVADPGNAEALQSIAGMLIEGGAPWQALYHDPNTQEAIRAKLREHPAVRRGLLEVVAGEEERPTRTSVVGPKL